MREERRGILLRKVGVGGAKHDVNERRKARSKGEDNIEKRKGWRKRHGGG